MLLDRLRYIIVRYNLLILLFGIFVFIPNIKQHKKYKMPVYQIISGVR